MISRWFGVGSQAGILKSHLDFRSENHRQIAHRIANASTPGFTDALSAAQGPVDVEKEMVRLADNQLSYEATHQLLRKTYASFRTAFRSS